MPDETFRSRLRRWPDLRLWLSIWVPGVLLGAGLLAALPNPAGRWQRTLGVPDRDTPALAADLSLGQRVPAQARPVRFIGLRFQLVGAKTDSKVELLLLRGGRRPVDRRAIKDRLLARSRVGHKRLRGDRFWRWDLEEGGGQALRPGKRHFLLVRLHRARGGAQIKLQGAALAEGIKGALALTPAPGGLSARPLALGLVLELGDPGKKEPLLASLASSAGGWLFMAALLLGSAALLLLLVPDPRGLLALARRRPAAGTALFSPEQRRVWLPAVAVALAVFCARLLQIAWVSDDAYLTFRAVVNFVEGYGPIWNPGERVQIYTHPLWFLLLSAGYLVTGSCYAAALGLSLAASLAVAVVLARWVAVSPPAAVLALLLLALSGGYMDFSTSGLENPLVHLLLVLFAAALLGRGEPRGDTPEERAPDPGTLLRLWLLGGLLLLARMDSVLLVAPALGLASWRHLRLAGAAGWRRALVGAARLAALGLSPFVCWELFSLLYYGTPFPNTAYAKLNTGIPAAALLRQGQIYLLNALSWDPATLIIITASAAVPVAARRGRRRLLALLAGALLYLLYVVKIGGCFMSARLLAAPLLLAAVAWARLPVAPGRLWRGALPLLVLVSVVTGTQFGKKEVVRFRATDYPMQSGVVDERMWYFNTRGLITQTRRRDLADRPERTAALPKSYQLCGGAGLRGFEGGHDNYVVDPCALGDAFLARIPSSGAYDFSWRVGHYERFIPRGYAATLSTGQNLLLSPDLSAYYEQLRVVIAGDLLAPGRLGAIWRLNSGALDPLLQGFAARELSAQQLATPRKTRAGATRLAQGGAVVELPRRSFARALELSLGRQGRYRVVFIRAGRKLAHTDVGPAGPGPDLKAFKVKVPAAAVDRGYDRLRVLPLSGREAFLLGHLLLR